MKSEAYKTARRAAFENMRAMGMGVRGSMLEAVAYAKSQDRSDEIKKSDAVSTLRVASRALQNFGATESQIQLIVKLAIEANNIDGIRNITRLSKKDASIIIDDMLNR